MDAVEPTAKAVPWQSKTDPQVVIHTEVVAWHDKDALWARSQHRISVPTQTSGHISGMGAPLSAYREGTTIMAPSLKQNESSGPHVTSARRGLPCEGTCRPPAHVAVARNRAIGLTKQHG